MKGQKAMSKGNRTNGHPEMAKKFAVPSILDSDSELSEGNSPLPKLKSSRASKVIVIDKSSLVAASASTASTTYTTPTVTTLRHNHS